MKTTYLKEKILKHVTGEATFTKPTDTYIGLFTADPTVAGVQDDEVTGGSYARQDANFVYDSDTQTSRNSADITFENMPGVTVTHWAIFDAATNGNMLFYEPVLGELIVGAGIDLTLQAGNLIYRES